MIRTQQIHLPMRPISKPRPRAFMGQRRPYNDPVYKQWIKQAKAHMSEFWTHEPLEKLKILYVVFRGPARGDLDNRLGAVMDAGNGIIWKDDKVTVIPSIDMKWLKTSEKEARIFMQVTWEDDK